MRGAIEAQVKNVEGYGQESQRKGKMQKEKKKLSLLLSSIYKKCKEILISF